MRKIVFLIIGISIFSTLFSKDKLDNHRRISIYNDSCLINAVVFTVNKMPAGRLSSNKFYFWFQRDKLLITQGNYSGSVLDGLFEQYDHEGHLQAKGYIRKGLLDGKWQYWSKNGVLTKEIEYKNGFICGDFLIYEKNGTLKEKKHFDKEIKSGFQYVYENGTLISKTKYRNGKTVKSFQYKNLKKTKTIKYKNGEEIIEQVKPDPKSKKKRWYQNLKLFKRKREVKNVTK